MTLPLRQPFAPMEALSVDSIPVGEAWRYEPKRDGFRCLAFRDGAKIRPLDEPLFSGIGSVWQAQAENNGEIVVLADGAFSFDALTSYLMGFAGTDFPILGDTESALTVSDVVSAYVMTS